MGWNQASGVPGQFSCFSFKRADGVLKYTLTQQSDVMGCGCKGSIFFVLLGLPFFPCFSLT